MLRQILLSFIVFGFVDSAKGQNRVPDLTLRFESGHNWKMTPTLKNEFSGFLNLEMEKIKTQVKDLYWPEISANTQFKDVLTSSFYPGSTAYKNRPLQCSFVQKVLATTSGSARARFIEITRNGTICIQFDLPESDWAGFTKSLMDFFWTEKWIALNSENLSLEDLAIQAVGPTYRRPEFHIASELYYDGYGWGHSSSELALFDSDPILARFASIARSFDPNSTLVFSALGSEMGGMLKGAPYEVVGAIQPSSKIYLSKAWGPADMVELLAHEYGHVIHGETNSNKSWNFESRILVTASNRVHDESVAESFAWMLLRDIYDTYPEVEFFHIAKLQALNVLRPNDPHLVGAAAIHHLFHSKSKGTFSDLIEYAEASDLGVYLSNHGLIDKLENLGLREAKTVPIFFESK